MWIIGVLSNSLIDETKLVLACYCDHCSQIDLCLRVTGFGASRLQNNGTCEIRDLAFLGHFALTYVRVWKYANRAKF